jgi:hypothetical protein
MSSQHSQIPVERPTTTTPRLMPLPAERRGGRLLSAVEELLAAGQMPHVSDWHGRLGRVVRYNRSTRQAWVAWSDRENPGLGEPIPLEYLHLR